MPRHASGMLCLLVGATLGLGVTGTALADDHPAAFDQMVLQSQQEKFGLVFFIKGQQIPGVVTRVVSNGLVEVRNQQHDRILIRLERVDAIAGR